MISRSFMNLAVSRGAGCCASAALAACSPDVAPSASATLEATSATWPATTAGPSAITRLALNQALPKSQAGREGRNADPRSRDGASEAWTN